MFERDLARAADTLAQTTPFRRDAVLEALEAGAPTQLIILLSRLGERDGSAALAYVTSALRMATLKATVHEKTRAMERAGLCQWEYRSPIVTAEALAEDAEYLKERDRRIIESCKAKLIGEPSERTDDIDQPAADAGAAPDAPKRDR